VLSDRGLLCNHLVAKHIEFMVLNHATMCDRIKNPRWDKFVTWIVRVGHGNIMWSVKILHLTQTGVSPNTDFFSDHIYIQVSYPHKLCN